MKWWNPRTWGGKSRWGVPILDLLAASGDNVNGYTYSKGVKQGYMDTDIVFSGVDLISSSMSSVPVRGMRRTGDGKSEPLEENHPLNKLLRSPNPLQKQNDFMYAEAAFRLLGGQAYTWVNTGVTDEFQDSSSEPLELWAMSPETATMESRNGQFQFKINTSQTVNCVGPQIGQRTIPVDAVTGQANMINWKTFNPLSMCEGMSPLKPANIAIDIYRAGNIWNRGYFKNGCRPSTALTSKDPIPDKTYNRIKKELTELYSGLQNGNGRPIILDMMTPTELSASPKDADFSGSSAEMQKNIFRVLNIPPILLNIGGDTTFSNQKEAQLWFWDNMIIPMTEDYVMEMNRNITPRYRDPSIFIEADYSEIPALEPRRTQLWERANKADFITLNEKRAMVGMPSTEGGDVILVPSAQIPLSMASFNPPE